MKTYLYSGLGVLSDGQSRFLDGAGIDEHLQADTPTGSLSHLSDHLGSTSQLLDAGSGAPKARLDYKSYGKLEGDIDNPAPANAYTYTGREDDGTGLMYYRARYYDPELEIFISQDPLGDAQRYVGGNPMGFVDPEGLEGTGNQACLVGMSSSGTCIEDLPILPGFILDMCGLKGLGGGIRGGGSVASLVGNSERITHLLTKANSARGFVNIGHALESEINIVGKAWVGAGYRYSKDGQALVSKDGLLIYRFPKYKNGMTLPLGPVDRLIAD